MSCRHKKEMKEGDIDHSCFKSILSFDPSFCLVLIYSDIS